MTRVSRWQRVLLVAVCSSGCGVAVDGDFDGLRFTPDASVMALCDRHELFVVDGAVVPRKKAKKDQTVSLLLTAGRVDVGSDWRALTGQATLELGRELAVNDGVLLQGMRLADLEQGNTLVASGQGAVLDGANPFGFAIVHPSSLDAADDALQALGEDIAVTVTPGDVSAEPHGGSISLDIEIKRSRGADQRGPVATGAVTLSLSTSFLPERLTDSNFSVAAPIMTCAQASGPAGAAACRNADPLPIVDDTGPHP